MLWRHGMDHRAGHTGGLTPQLDQELAIAVVYVIGEDSGSQHVREDCLEVS